MVESTRCALSGVEQQRDTTNVFGAAFLRSKKDAGEGKTQFNSLPVISKPLFAQWHTVKYGVQGIERSEIPSILICFNAFFVKKCGGRGLGTKGLLP
jgi:hypothetical protein